jgi:SAM-dependent methyltransferase/uncharacterized protein YbaR (Trm112 family)
MWKRITDTLRCPSCAEALTLQVFEDRAGSIDPQHADAARERQRADPEFDRYVDAGVLLCGGCRVWFPVLDGLPILLTYATGAHQHFKARYADLFRRASLGAYSAPDRQPPVGEQFVLDSFSTEWADYEYDGVLWEARYDDLEKRVLKEVGVKPGLQIGTFLEVGCGLGVTTSIAQRNFCLDAFGVDLSRSVFQASRHFATNPFLHFVQASVFNLPFAKASFDVAYTRGVLHHTFSTYEAAKALASYCRPGGELYIWVYGTASIRDNALRRLLYASEKAVRPILSRRPDGLLGRMFIGTAALAYLAFNSLRRIGDSTIQSYSFGRAKHAARDRFTPMFAHRHASAEVQSWFAEFGFTDIEAVDWKDMPSVERDDFRRNVGVRGLRAGAPGVARTGLGNASAAAPLRSAANR